jgi:hypothetical protein
MKEKSKVLKSPKTLKQNIKSFKNPKRTRKTINRKPSKTVKNPKIFKQTLKQPLKS